MNKGKRFYRLTFVLFIVFAATLQIGGCKKPPITPVPGPKCNCSLVSLVCSVGVSTCVSVPCIPENNMNGRCSSYTIDMPPIPQPQRSIAVKLFNLSFSSYEGAIKAGSGGPDEKSWAMIEKDAPSEKTANVVKAMTNDFLYISLGNDFKALTVDGLQGACEIDSVPNKMATLALVDAVKKGTMLAVEKNNPTEVKAPIMKFFEKYTNYKPNNPGFCYSENNPGTPMDCIGDALEKRLELLVGTK